MYHGNVNERHFRELHMVRNGSAIDLEVTGSDLLGCHFFIPSFSLTMCNSLTCLALHYHGTQTTSIILLQIIENSNRVIAAAMTMIHRQYKSLPKCGSEAKENTVMDQAFQFSRSNVAMVLVFFIPANTANTLAALVVVTLCNLRWWSFS